MQPVTPLVICLRYYMDNVKKYTNEIFFSITLNAPSGCPEGPAQIFYTC